MPPVKVAVEYVDVMSGRARACLLVTLPIEALPKLLPSERLVDIISQLRTVKPLIDIAQETARKYLREEHVQNMRLICDLTGRIIVQLGNGAEVEINDPETRDMAETTRRVVETVEEALTHVLASHVDEITRLLSSGTCRVSPALGLRPLAVDPLTLSTVKLRLILDIALEQADDNARKMRELVQELRNILTKYVPILDKCEEVTLWRYDKAISELALVCRYSIGTATVTVYAHRLDPQDADKVKKLAEELTRHNKTLHIQYSTGLTRQKVENEILPKIVKEIEEKLRKILED